MKAHEILLAISGRIATLSLLEQPGPVDLGDEEDNQSDQDSLFYELAALRQAREAIAPLFR